MPELQNARKARFGPFEADFASGELRKHGLRLKLSGQPISILEMLLEVPGELVTRDQIRERLWPGNTFVDFDHSLNAAVNKLRDALGDSADSPQYVETVPRRGYRFIGTLDKPAAESEAVAPEIATAPASSPAKTHNRRAVAYTVVATILLAAAALLYNFGSRRKLHFSSPPERTTLAVLPFDNLSGDATQDYLSDGITEELSTELAQFDPTHMAVIARLSATHYKHSPKSLTQIGQELGAEYLLEGSVRRDATHIRITTQLIRASDQTHVWASNYDREMRDVLELQSDVARSVAHEIGLRISPAPRRSPGQIDPDTYRAYLMSKTTGWQGGFLQAQEQLEQLVKEKPDYAPGWAALAWTKLNISGRIKPQQPLMSEAREAANHAVQLDPNNGQAHAVLGMVHFFYDFDWKAAETEMQQGIKVDPTDYRVSHAYVLVLAASGRKAEANAMAERMVALEPLPEIVSCQEARINRYTGESDRVVARIEELKKKRPDFRHRCYWITLSYLEQGDKATALSDADLISANSNQMEYKSVAGYIFGRAGQPDKARAILRDLEDRRKKGEWISDYNLALINLGLGENEKALSLLESSANEPSGVLVYLNVDPMYAPLKGNPRFTALMRKVHIPGV